ncbi:MAG: LacI family DNA-binding transcriptional regulator [Phycisphaeraceae bacterium JB051]
MTQTASNNKTTSLADIAQLCGTTKATVSRVLNAKPGFSVRQELSDKIHQAAAELNYRPNGIARSLRSNKTPIVMVLGFHPHWMTSDGPTVYGEMVSTLTARLAKGSTACFMDLATDDDRSPELSSLVPDAAIVVPPLTDLRYRKLTQDRIPFVLVNEVGPKDVSFVYTDDKMGSHMLVEHLYELGHRRIAYMNQTHFGPSFEYHSSLANRMNGYVDAMQAHGLEPIPGYDQPIHAEPFFEDVILAHRATAVISYKSSYLKVLHEIAQHKNMSVPGDLSLCGFDRQPPNLFNDFEFTIIDIPMKEMGEHAARIIQEKLNNPNYHEQYKCHEKLMIHQSTGPVPG